MGPRGRLAAQQRRPARGRLGGWASGAAVRQAAGGLGGQGESARPGQEAGGTGGAEAVAYAGVGQWQPVSGVVGGGAGITAG